MKTTQGLENKIIIGFLILVANSGYRVLCQNTGA